MIRRVARMAAASPCPVLGYAVEGDAEVRAEDVVLDAELRPRFRLSTPWGAGEVRLALHGVQQVPNALAAAAAALWCGVPFDGVVSALAAATGSAAAHGGAPRPAAAPSWWSTATTPTPRRPRRRCAPWRPLPAARKMALLGLMAELGVETEARAPADGPAGRAARDRGRRLPDRALRARPRWTASDDAVALLRTMGPGDAAPREGQPGGAPRRRGPARTGTAAGDSVAGDRRVARRRRLGAGGADEDPAGQLAVEGLGARPRASSPDRGRRPCVGTRAIRAGGGPRRLRPPPAPWRTGRAPRCRARRARARSRPHRARVEETGIGGQRGHGTGGVDEDRRDAPTVALGLPPRVARQRVGQRLAFDQVECGAVVGDGGRSGSACAFPSAARAIARCTSTVTRGESW